MKHKVEFLDEHNKVFKVVPNLKGSMLLCLDNENNLSMERIGNLAMDDVMGLLLNASVYYMKHFTAMLGIDPSIVYDRWNLGFSSALDQFMPDQLNSSNFDVEAFMKKEDEEIEAFIKQYEKENPKAVEEFKKQRAERLKKHGKKAE